MKNIKIIIIIGVVLIAGICFLKNSSAQKSQIVSVQNLMSSDTSIEENTLEDEDSIKIHIYGEVNSPGLIELKVGSRVYDAIEVAGGATSLADITKVNLAYILSDGEKIYIPSINDEVDETETTAVQTGSTKVNINTASQEQLETLNGIGESIAQSIIEYRNKNGKFSSIEDIKNVSGIGDSKFEKIKDYICIK